MSNCQIYSTYMTDRRKILFVKKNVSEKRKWSCLIELKRFNGIGFPPF